MRADTNSTDIINRKDWSKSEWLIFFQGRLVDMRAKRQPFDKKWAKLDKSATAVSFYDNSGELQVNIPLEKVLREIYEGRTRGKVNYDIRPDGQANVEELQPAKYALMFFLDGNLKSNFWIENKKMRGLKAHYGNGIFYTGIRSDISIELEQKEDIEPGTDILDKSNFREIKKEEWYFFPKSIKNQDFYMDDSAYGQSTIQGGRDCIMRESIKMIDLELRFKNKKNIDQKELGQVTYFTDGDSKDDTAIKKDDVFLYYYFNRVTKTYMIVANETHVLYNGYYFYKDGKLPFVNVQHYYDPNNFRTDGISGRVSYLKAYKSEVFQNILSGSAMAAGINLVVGNDEEIGQDWSYGGRQMNLWRTTGGAENVKQVSTNVNLGFFTTVMQLIDSETAIVTGINPAEQINATSDVLGIVEINEANKAVRSGSVDESYDIGLDNALTMTLDRIKQFAPYLLATTTKDSEGKVLKTTFPAIKIDNMKVVKRQGKKVFEEDLGKYGYFEMKPGVVQGIGVKVTTPSTNSVLPIVERRKINEYIENANKLGMLAQMDATGESMKKLNEFINMDQLVDWMNDAYGYDANGLKANTQKDKIRLKNIKKLNDMKKALEINPKGNVGSAGKTETKNIVPSDEKAGAQIPTSPTVGEGEEIPTGI